MVAGMLQGPTHGLIVGHEALHYSNFGGQSDDRCMLTGNEAPQHAGAKQSCLACGRSPGNHAYVGAHPLSQRDY